LSNKKAFTLIELMIVVTIIGLLATVSMPKFADMLKRAEQASSKNNLGVLRSVGGIYYADHLGEFAYQLTPVTAGDDYKLITMLDSLDDNAFVPKYLNEIPAFRCGIQGYPNEDVRDIAVAGTAAGGKFDYATRSAQEGAGAPWVYIKETGMWYVNCLDRFDTTGVSISTW